MFKIRKSLGVKMQLEKFLKEFGPNIFFSSSPKIISNMLFGTPKVKIERVMSV